MSRERVTYSEKYRPGAMRFTRPEKLPTLRHLANGFEPVALELREAGNVVVDGEEMEYQVLRVYLREAKP